MRADEAILGDYSRFLCCAISCASSGYIYNGMRTSLLFLFYSLMEKKLIQKVECLKKKQIFDIKGEENLRYHREQM